MEKCIVFYALFVDFLITNIQNENNQLKVTLNYYLKACSYVYAETLNHWNIIIIIIIIIFHQTALETGDVMKAKRGSFMKKVGGKWWEKINWTNQGIANIHDSMNRKHENNSNKLTFHSSFPHWCF